MRKKVQSPAPQPPAAAARPPVRIDPRTVFTSPQLRRALLLKRETIRREIRLGRLRVSRRAGRYYFLGSWVLQWLRTGERRQPAADQGSSLTPERG